MCRTTNSGASTDLASARTEPASSSLDSTAGDSGRGWHQRREGRGLAGSRSAALGGSGSQTRESDRPTSGRMPGVVQAHVRMKPEETARERVQQGVPRAVRFGTPDH